MREFPQGGLIGKTVNLWHRVSRLRVSLYAANASFFLVLAVFPALLLLLGLVQPVIYLLCENYGISMTSTSFSGIIIGTIPVFGLLGGRLFLKERISPRQCVCAAFSLLGVAMTTAGGTISFSPLGVVLLFTAAISSVLFNVISRSIAPRGEKLMVPPTVVIATPSRENAAQIH